MQTLIFRTTPTVAVGFIICEEPIHIATIVEWAQTIGRLTTVGKLARGAKHNRLRIDITELTTLSMRHE